MRVHISTYRGNWNINTGSVTVLAAWLAEVLPKIVPRDYSEPQPGIEIWPEHGDTMGIEIVRHIAGPDDLRSIAGSFLHAADSIDGRPSLFKLADFLVKPEPAAPMPEPNFYEADRREVDPAG